MNVECPACLGNKKIFTGEDYEDCSFCNGIGNVTKNKASNFDPITDVKYDNILDMEIEENFNDDFENS